MHFFDLFEIFHDALCSLTNLNQSRHFQIDRCVHILQNKTIIII